MTGIKQPDGFFLVDPSVSLNNSNRIHGFHSVHLIVRFELYKAKNTFIMPSRLTLAALCAAFVALADADYATDTYTMVSGGEITTITDTYLANYYDSAVPIYTVSSWCGDGADSVSASLCISEVASSLDYYSYGCSFERVVSVYGHR